MPTEDYSHTRRIARARQIASLKGLNKVARAIDSETQLVIKLGGILNVMKTPTGLRSNCGRCSYNTYTFPVDATVIAVYFIGPGHCDIGEIFSSISITRMKYYNFVSDFPIPNTTIGSFCPYLLTYQSGVFYPGDNPGEYIMILPYRSEITEEDIKNIFPQLRGYTSV